MTGLGFWRRGDRAGSSSSSSSSNCRGQCWQVAIAAAAVVPFQVVNGNYPVLLLAGIRHSNSSMAATAAALAVLQSLGNRHHNQQQQQQPATLP